MILSRSFEKKLSFLIFFRTLLQISLTGVVKTAVFVSRGTLWVKVFYGRKMIV